MCNHTPQYKESKYIAGLHFSMHDHSRGHLYKLNVLAL